MGHKVSETSSIGITSGGEMVDEEEDRKRGYETFRSLFKMLKLEFATFSSLLDERYRDDKVIMVFVETDYVS